jgi:hypothetical protein
MLTVGMVSSCQSELPIEYETEHLRIGTDLDHPLCQGDLVALEQIIGRIEDELSIEMPGTATVYVWDVLRWSPESTGYCRRDTFGCTNTKSLTIWTSTVALEHELVHAVIGETSLAPFFNEGLADVYSGRQTRFGHTRPSANEGTSGRTADRGTGRHFVRWLRERWGSEPLGRLVRAGDRTFGSFEAIYGMSVEAAEALYFEDAPLGYPAMYICDSQGLAEAPSGRGWRDDVALDCSLGVDTRVAGIGMKTHRSFAVQESGYYTINIDADWFDIFRCGDPRIEAVASSSDHLDDAPVHHASYPSGSSRHYFGRGAHDLYLHVGVHDIAIGLLGHEHGLARIAIEPALGAQPAK